MQADLEVLISTRDRTDWKWLDVMFPGGIRGFDVLVVHQTARGEAVPSGRENVRILPQRDYGLSRSRNLGLENARGRILLLADDDMIFTPGFHSRVIEAHRRYEEPVLVFPMQNERGEYFGHHTEYSRPMTDVRQVYSGQISIKIPYVKRTGIRFDERFGLGAPYPDSENFVFLTSLMRRGAGIRYAGGEAIVTHPGQTSSHYLERPQNIKARMAVYKLLYPQTAYLRMWKLMFFLVRTGRIKASEVGKYVRMYGGIKL